MNLIIIKTNLYKKTYIKYLYITALFLQIMLDIFLTNAKIKNYYLDVFNYLIII